MVKNTQSEDGNSHFLNPSQNTGRVNKAEVQTENSQAQQVMVILTEEHLRKLRNDHLLREIEVGDRAKIAHTVQKLVDTRLGLPDTIWRDWDEWAGGLE